MTECYSWGSVLPFAVFLWFVGLVSGMSVGAAFVLTIIARERDRGE